MIQSGLKIENGKAIRRFVIDLEIPENHNFNSEFSNKELLSITKNRPNENRLEHLIRTVLSMSIFYRCEHYVVDVKEDTGGKIHVPKIN